MDPKSILKDAKERMDKALEHLRGELRGIRTGRASTALVEYIKVEYYGSMTDLKSLAAISVADASQLLIKPFDIGALGEIRKAIETSDLGLNPQVDGKQLRINIPSLSTDRRKQLSAHAKKITEETKVALRNVRRDANKHADALKKSTTLHYAEDQIEDLKKEIQDLLKQHEGVADKVFEDKSAEIMAV